MAQTYVLAQYTAVLQYWWCSSARICGAALTTEYSLLVLTAVWSRLCVVQWAICSFKKADMNEEEWEDTEETVKQPKVDLDDMLVDFSKVMEGYWRLENKERKVKE